MGRNNRLEKVRHGALHGRAGRAAGTPEVRTRPAGQRTHRRPRPTPSTRLRSPPSRRVRVCRSSTGHAPSSTRRPTGRRSTECPPPPMHAGAMRATCPSSFAAASTWATATSSKTLSSRRAHARRHAPRARPRMRTRARMPCARMRGTAHARMRHAAAAAAPCCIGAFLSRRHLICPHLRRLPITGLNSTATPRPWPTQTATARCGERACTHGALAARAHAWGRAQLRSG